MTRLTEEMVIARSKQSDLGQIKKLNCWGSDLTDVSIIKRMRGVEVLALSVNKISTLQPFETCSKLQELYLRKNNIQDIREIGYLQNLPSLRYLWLEENPCCQKAGPGYRTTVLRALPNLKKLDNIDVTQEEVEDALRAGSENRSDTHDEDENEQHSQAQQQQQQQQQMQQQVQQQQQQQQYQQQSTRRGSSPKEPSSQTSPAKTEESICESKSGSPSQRSPGSDQESSPGYRERAPLPPSISTHSMKEYYHTDRPTYPTHYRHSQTDLTEWEEHNQNNQFGSTAALNHGGRRSIGGDRDANERYNYRNGNARDNGEWDENERARQRASYRPDSSNAVSAAVLNHYTGYHRRPINRSSNLLSATLCLIKELDYSSLEVIEHAVRCRIEELSAE